MYRKTWLTIASLFVVSVPLVAQETGGFWSTLETGVTVAAGRGATSDIGIGYSQTFVTKNTFSTGVMLSGIVASVGQRIALGTYGVFRPEFVALRDCGAARDNLYYSGVMRFSARVGLSFYFPQYW
ncbi:MAG: hypothetical protein ABJC26_12095 [Gemmatimonadaceae bacterium]